MKKIIINIFVISSLVGAGVSWVYNEINALKSELFNLKAFNMKLKEKNTQLVQKQKRIENKIKQRRALLEQQKLKRAKNKLAKASVGALPFVGTAAVVSLTYDEIQNYCKDIQEYKKFEASIVPNTNNASSETEQALCGYSYDAIERIVINDIESIKATILD